MFSLLTIAISHSNFAGGMGMADRMQQNPFNNMSRPSDGGKLILLY